MKVAALLILLLLLQGCTTKVTEFDRLSASLETNQLVSFKYADWKIPAPDCNNRALQDLLVGWKKSLHPAGIASWPTGTDMILSFENGNEFNMSLFTGNDNLKYSVLYLRAGIKTEGGTYAGRPLKLGDACSWKAN